MTMNYEEVISEISGNKFIKRENEDGTTSFIPMDKANSDYQAYLNKDKPVEQSTPSLIDEA